MNQIKTLVVGQGIAGSLVAFMLYLHKSPFMVIDAGEANSSSRIAAGMFTPISGKRKTIHPMVLQQIPYAVKTYKEIEQLIGIPILHLHNIYQVHNSVAEQQQLAEKSANPDFAKYTIREPPALPNIKQEMGAFEITHSGWVDCEVMILRFAQWLKQKNALLETEFLYNDLRISAEAMKYHGMEFSHIVFCDGYRAINNPFFDNENIIPCSGDILTIKYDHSFMNRIIKRNGIYLIPAGNNIFRAGSTYYWNNNSTKPEEAGKKLIEKQLDAMLEFKYTTIDHKKAIRPTTQNREVIARQHPIYPGIFMLNGLGTKGVLQGPWWAKYIAGVIVGS